MVALGNSINAIDDHWVGCVRNSTVLSLLHISYLVVEVFIPLLMGCHIRIMHFDVIRSDIDTIFQRYVFNRLTNAKGLK